MNCFFFLKPNYTVITWIVENGLYDVSAQNKKVDPASGTQLRTKNYVKSESLFSWKTNGKLFINYITKWA